MNIREPNITIFEDFKIRRLYSEEKELWFFSVIDIIAVLTDQKEYKKAQSYWTTLKSRLKREGSQVVTNCDKLKLLAADGKKYNTDVADVETIFRLVQSVPSKKAEPIKLWLAKVGRERISEISNPEESLNRARDSWEKMGRSKKWVQQRMMGQETRNKLTDYWNDHGVRKGREYSILTNIIHTEWSGLSVKEHKKLKNLKVQNLRDHMSEAELIFTALAELSTKQIAQKDDATGYKENESAAYRGGNVSKNAKEQLESEIDKKIVDETNFLNSKEQAKRIK